MPKTRSGVHGAAAGPTTQAAIKDLLRSLRPEEAKKALEDASKALAAAKPSVPACLYFCSAVSPDA